jgi:hypothetical protein
MQEMIVATRPLLTGYELPLRGGTTGVSPIADDLLHGTKSAESVLCARMTAWGRYRHDGALGGE